MLQEAATVAKIGHASRPGQPGDQQRRDALRLGQLDLRLLNEFQRGFPLVSEPYAEIAVKLGVNEAVVLERLRVLGDAGIISRVGAVFGTGTVGASTLAAMAVPASRLELVARLVNSYSEVNHNYEREHKFNLWFVVTAENEARVEAVLEDMERRTGLRVISLPMLEDYHVDLGFSLETGHAGSVEPEEPHG